MNTSDFDVYWKQYIKIEKEFNSILEYVTLDKDNFYTFSDEFVKILLEIGSEIDIICKKYCEEIDISFSGKNINDYRNCITSKIAGFSNQKVIELYSEITFIPWQNWVDGNNPYWWTAYNKVKHNRTENVTINNKTKFAYKFANLENVLNALAAYYQILIYFYYELAQKENKIIKSPLPGSRHFNLKEELGDKIAFYFDTAKYVEDGCLMEEINNKIFY